MIRITGYAGESPTDTERPGSVKVYGPFEDCDVNEALRQIGLEWKTADYMTQRQVVLVLDPVEDDKQPDVRGLVRKAAEMLEETGML